MFYFPRLYINFSLLANVITIARTLIYFDTCRKIRWQSTLIKCLSQRLRYQSINENISLNIDTFIYSNLTKIFPTNIYNYILLTSHNKNELPCYLYFRPKSFIFIKEQGFIWYLNRLLEIRYRYIVYRNFFKVSNISIRNINN